MNIWYQPSIRHHWGASVRFKGGDFRVSTFPSFLSSYVTIRLSSLIIGDPDYELLVYITNIIDVTEYIVVIFFLVEYLIRLTTCPRKIKFFFGLMNLIDFLALIPFFLSLLLEGLEDFEIVGKTGKIIRLIRVMRILRVFKLVRHFAGLQSLFYTLKQAYKELGLLIILVAVGILLYSNLVYFCEREVYDTSGINCTDWEETLQAGRHRYKIIYFLNMILIFGWRYDRFKFFLHFVKL